MNFSTTVQWHIKWLTDILNTIEQNPTAMNADEIARDDRCDFGKWLHDHRDRYADLPEFTELNEAHMALHQSAAAAVRVAHSGHLSDAKAYLSPDGQFIELSKHLLDCSGHFFDKVDKGADS